MGGGGGGGTGVIEKKMDFEGGQVKISNEEWGGGDILYNSDNGSHRFRFRIPVLGLPLHATWNKSI